jgi:hypothetical protein
MSSLFIVIRLACSAILIESLAICSEISSKASFNARKAEVDTLSAPACLANFSSGYKGKSLTILHHIFNFYSIVVFIINLFAYGELKGFKDIFSRFNQRKGIGHGE